MYGIFMESWVIFKLYGGSGWLLFLYILSLLLLFLLERDRAVRLFFLWLPLGLLLLFFFPLFRRVYVRFVGGGDTQYRMLWLLPMGMTVSYAGCRLTTLLPMREPGLGWKRALDRVALPLLIGSAIAAGGSLVYRNPYVSRAENLYHVPQEAVEVARAVKEGSPRGERVRVAAPETLVHFLRQIDTDIIQAYGRDIIAYGYYNEIHEKMERGPQIVMGELAEALRVAEVDRLVLRRDRPVDEAPEAWGWLPCAETESYIVYEAVTVQSRDLRSP